MNTNTDQRVQREAEAYNEGSVYQNSVKLQGRFWHVFSCPNTLHLKGYMNEVIRTRVPGAVVLDYGCYEGGSTSGMNGYHPRKLVGIDISDVAIAKANENYGDIASFYAIDAHATHFEDNTFDFIVGRSILHHLDWEKAIQEIHRILKPGGTVVFSEPLGDNPMAKLFRRLTPQARTPDELPLSKAQIQWANRIIGNAHHCYGNLVSVPLAMLTSLISDNPNNVLLRIGNAIDQRLAKTFIKYWMRSVVLVWEKTS